MESVTVHTVHLVYSKTQEPWKKGDKWVPGGMTPLGIVHSLQAVGFPWRHTSLLKV